MCIGLNEKYQLFLSDFNDICILSIDVIKLIVALLNFGNVPTNYA